MMQKISGLQPGPLDIHAHVAPERLIAALEGGARPGFEVRRGDDGSRRLVLGGEPMRMPVMPAMSSPEIRLAAMQEQGVAAQLVSPWIALVDDRLQEADALWYFELLNETIAEFAQQTPDRFIGIGAVPLQMPEQAAAMLKVAMREQGLLGVEINTTLGSDRFLDDPALEPFWSTAEAEGAFILIHPSLGGLSAPFARYYLNNLIHNPLETTFAAAHLIFGGVMERYPDLKICLVHGGGFLPYDLGRLRRGRAVRPETKVAMQGSVEDSFHRFYFDTVTHSQSALRFLVGEAGPEHVLLGSDYPFDMGDPDLVGTVRAAALGSEAEALVLRGTAERVLRPK